jgi:chromosome segregation ATPase
MKEEIIERHASDFLPSGFDPIEAMRILTEYLRTLEISYNELVNKSTLNQRNMDAALRAANKTNDDLEQEKERLTRDLMALSNQVEELENHLSTANHKLSNFEKQSKKLHRDNEELENKLAKKENDNSFYIAEVERLRHDYEAVNSSITSVNNRADELERRLAAERNQILTSEKECRRLSSLLSESQSKTQILEQKLLERDTVHGDEIKKLNEKMGADAKHEVGLLRKRVKMAITPELEDLEKLSRDKLSAELASNLKALISRFISKLEQVGFDVTTAK